MKAIFLTFSLFYFYNSWSQTPSFEYQSLASQQQIASFSFQDSNEEYIISTELNEDCKIIKLNSEGDLLETNILERDGFECRIWHMFEQDNRYVAFGVQSYLAMDSTLLWVLEMDSELNVIEEDFHFIDYHRRGIPFQCNTQYADTLICVGTGSLNGAFPFEKFAFKYLANGELVISNIVWDENDIINDVVISPLNPNLYIINGSLDIQITNASFNLIESVITVYYNQIGDMHPFTDSTFLLAGKDIFGVDEIRMGIFDYSGNELNYVAVGVVDSISHTTQSQSIDIFENSIFFGGTSRVIETPLSLTSNSISNFVLAKYDHKLEEQWLRFYGGDAYYYMGHLHATQDGGCLMIGSKHDFENNPGIAQLYVLKVNQDGDIVNTTTIPFEDTKLKVYPNPTNYELVVELSSTQYAQSVKEVVLYDLLGRKMLEREMELDKVVLDLSDLPAANYRVIVRNDDGEVIAEEQVVKVE